MADSRTVLILGGGVGGLVAAGALRKLLPKKDRIIVVDRQERHVFQPSFLWVMTGDRRPEDISRPLARLNRKGMEFVRGEIEGIDPKKKTVVVSGRTLTGDAMVISLGAELAVNAVPGLAESGQTFYTLEGARAIREALARFQGGRIVILTAAPMYKCPAAPYEAALLIEYFCRRRNLGQKTQIAVYAAEPAPMGTAGPELSQAVRRMVESRGIPYHPNRQITKADAGSRRIYFADGASADYDLLFYVPPHLPPRAVRETGLAGETGWVAADRQTLETKFENVYAVGDAVSIPLKMGKPLPKAGVFAEGQAKVVANNLARDWTGKGRAKTFDGFGECFIEIGDHRAGMGSGNFYAEPTPQVEMRPPGLRWHFAKVCFEKYWLLRHLSPLSL